MVRATEVSKSSEKGVDMHYGMNEVLEIAQAADRDDSGWKVVELALRDGDTAFIPGSAGGAYLCTGDVGSISYLIHPSQVIVDDLFNVTAVRA